MILNRKDYNAMVEKLAYEMYIKSTNFSVTYYEIEPIAYRLLEIIDAYKKQFIIEENR